MTTEQKQQQLRTETISASNFIDDIKKALSSDGDLKEFDGLKLQYEFLREEEEEILSIISQVNSKDKTFKEAIYELDILKINLLK